MNHPTQRVAQLLRDAQNPERLLASIVHESRIALHVNACSIFLQDQDDFVLVATAGKTHGVTRFPVLDDSASSGIQIIQPPGSESRLLAIPIRRNSLVIGALVLHKTDVDNLSAIDEALLLTISMQVAAAVRRIAYVKPISEQQAGEERLSDLLPDELQELFNVYAGIVIDSTFSGR